MRDTTEVSNTKGPKTMKIKKTTRTCVICKNEKPLDQFGPTASQVACKGECLKAYSAAARARRKARLALAQENSIPVYSPILSAIGAHS